MRKFLYYLFICFIGFSSCAALFSLSVLWDVGNDLPDYRYLQSYQTKAMSRVYSDSDNIMHLVNFGADDGAFHLPVVGRQVIGSPSAVATSVREFEGVRDFFSSASLVALIDTPVSYTHLTLPTILLV